MSESQTGSDKTGDAHKRDSHACVASAYAKLVHVGVIERDGAQAELADKLDQLCLQVSASSLSNKASSLGWFFNRSRKGASAPKGLYIHGAVGRGKSMLMDLFFDCAPVERKRRVHFNEFMQDVHGRIHRQRARFAEGVSREKDPIPVVARELAANASLLCFDEFSVTDIADAMILGRLFSALFDLGCTLVATSNVKPDNLYLNGLNRQLFLPFVDLLKSRVELFELDSRTDFRLEKLSSGKAFISPLGSRTSAAVNALWEMVQDGREEQTVVLKLKGRSLKATRTAGDAAWFTFTELCEEARGAEDYLAITNRFDTVFVTDIPMMDLASRNPAKRFILLVDTLYDNAIRTVFTAAANPHALYQGSSGNEVFEFQRTASRLIEMQSSDYLARSGPARSVRQPSG
ncbi:MAG: cell division protein ZapE [Rhizobiaceae bacterium]